MMEGPMDPLLRKALGASDTPVTPACLDAERLAAWSEGALPAADVAAIESHLSTCGRCQAMAAVFSRIEPQAPAATPLRSRLSVRWLIPLTVAAAAVLVWIAWPRNPDLSAPTQVARVEPQTDSVPLPPVGPPPVAGAEKQSRATPPPPPPPPPPPAARRSTPPASAVAEPPTKVAASPAVVAPKPAAVAPPPTPTYVPPVQATTTTADATRAAGAGLGSRNLSEATGVIEIVAPSTVTAQTAVVGAAAGGGRGARGGGGGGRTTAPPPVRWHILPTRVVERSTDGGTSWEPLVIDPPAAVTGGVAASNTTCWLIGPKGVVLRSVDGVHFDRVTFPESVDLVSIRSTGAATASVTTADGRVFITIDGGLTWRLQGFATSSF